MPLGRRINPTEANLPDTSGKGFEGRAEDAAENAASGAQTLFRTEEPRYTFDDIILNKSTYDAIRDVLVLYEKRELLFDVWGLGATHKEQNRAGINLYGHSGTGKSMAAHAIAHRLGRRILTVDYSQIESKYVGETSKNLVALFKYAKETGSVIFFDEADALLSRRVTDMSSSTDVSVNQTRSVLLVLINEYDDLIIFASNFISNYDPAFMRRILAHIKFELPEEEERRKLWELYIPKQMPTDADIMLLAQKFPGITGSDISNAVLNASLRAAAENEPLVRHANFENAVTRIIESKADNADIGKPISRRTVSEEYVKSQLGGELPK